MSSREKIWRAADLENLHLAGDKPVRVQEMFARIAGGYDRANRVLSLGQDARWRRQAVRLAKVGPNDEMLDVACGTGELARECLRAGARRVIALDFAPPMLAAAREKFSGVPIEWICGDAMKLPFEDGSFDVVTIGFGLRNLSDTPRALAEFRRVLRQGGRLMVLEFAWPERWLGRQVAHLAQRLFPWIGGAIAGERSAYRYLTSSVRTYLPALQMREAIAAAGFELVQSHEMALGGVAVHVGVRA